MVVSYLKLQALFDQLQQQLKTTFIWLSSMGYHSAIQSTVNITKSQTRLPNYLCSKFFKEFQGNDTDENKVDLLNFFHWLDEKLSEAHNPIALIINAEGKQKKEFKKNYPQTSRF